MARPVTERMQRAYEGEGGRGAEAFPWADIIKMIMSLFGGCTTPAAAKRWARRNPDACKDMIEEKLKAERTFSSTRDRSAAVEAAYSTFLTMSNDEIVLYS